VSSSVLLNGVSGKKNLLFLLLFVLAADLLQAILNKAMHQGIISAPLNGQACPDFPMI
jgi:hypothetical protein